MVFVKKCKIFHLFIVQGNMFRDILETRNTGLDHKNKKLRKLERLGFFPRG